MALPPLRAGVLSDPATGLRPASATIAGLDGVRAVSILIVMLSHSGLQHVVPGVFGVTIFFFISGYLITTLLLREHARDGHISVRAFYLRRIVRLYPPLLIYLAAMVAFQIVSQRGVEWWGLLGALFYFGNYLYALAPERIAPYGAHLWSLAIEEHFYLVFPFLFALLAARTRWLVTVLSVLCILALALRLGYSAAGIRSETYLLVATETRFDSILFGCLTAIAVNSQHGERFVEWVTHPAVVAGALALIVLSFVYRDAAFRQTWRFTVQGLALVPLVLAVVAAPLYRAIQSLFNSWPMRWTGALSYSLYLWHYVLFDLANHGLPAMPAPLRYAAGWALSFMVALLVFVLIERPLFALRRRLGGQGHAESRSG
ncbi:MAG: acyltransferase family protein [Beijerinckiaceae bacterium]